MDRLMLLLLVSFAIVIVLTSPSITGFAPRGLDQQGPVLGEIISDQPQEQEGTPTRDEPATEPAFGALATNITDCSTLDTEGEVYLLNQSIVDSAASTCMAIEADNVILDCQGFTIDGQATADTTGINSTGLNNVTVKNCILTSWNNGVYFTSTNSSLIINNTVRDSTDAGIVLDATSTSNLVTGNTLGNNAGYGIRILISNNNNVTNNNASFLNGEGIRIHLSTGNLVKNSTFSSNTRGIFLSAGSSNTLTNNTVDSNTQFGVSLIGSSNNNNVTVNRVFGNPGAPGLDLLGNSVNNLFSGNSFDSNGDGVRVSSSSNGNTFINNSMNSNSDNGINILSTTSNNVFVNNTAKSNSDWDFTSSGSSTNNTVVNLEIGSTIVSFDAKDIALRNRTSSPGATPTGTVDIGKFINATNNSADSWLFLNVSYTNADVSAVAEGTLRMWKFNSSSSSWTGIGFYETSQYGVDTLANVVFANITNFGSTFAPIAGNITSIDGCTTITGQGTYHLEQDITDSAESICMDIQADNVMLDCQGNTIDGIDTSGLIAGVRASFSDNVIVTNCVLTDWFIGALFNETNGTIQNNNVTSNADGLANVGGEVVFRNNTVIQNRFGIDAGGTIFGLIPTGSPFMTVINNTVNSNEVAGIVVGYDGLVENNTVNFNGFDSTGAIKAGILLFAADGYLITSNDFDSNLNGIMISPTGTLASNNSVFANNSAKNNTNWAIISELDSENNMITDLEIGSTVVSLQLFNAALNNASSPAADPSNRSSIGKYINATNTSSGSWLFLNVSYDEDEAPPGRLEDFTLAKYNSTEWLVDTSTFASDFGHDSANRIIFANITDFDSIYAPMLRSQECFSITSPGAYLLNGSVLNFADPICITVSGGTENVTIDCQGFGLDGVGSSNTQGIEVLFINNITIKNCALRDWTRGIGIFGTNNSLVLNNTATYNSDGIFIDGRNVTASNNTGLFNEIGLAFIVVNGTVSSNNFSFNDLGLDIPQVNNTVTNNVLVDNRIGISGGAGSLFDSNIVNGSTTYLTTTTPVGTSPGVFIDTMFDANFVNFTASSVEISNSTFTPLDPAGFESIGKFLNLTNLSESVGIAAGGPALEPSSILLNWSYAGTSGIEESQTVIAKFNESSGSWVTNMSKFSVSSGVNADGNYVFANITVFDNPFALLVVPVEEEAPAPSGGAGGAPPPPEGETYRLTLPGNIELFVGDTAEFEFDGEEHSVELLSLGTSSAVFEFSSTPFRVTLRTGELRIIDLNQDGVDDIVVTLERIASGKAFLELDLVTPAPEAAPPGLPPPERPFCGNNVCDAGESFVNCIIDCPVTIFPARAEAETDLIIITGSIVTAVIVATVLFSVIRQESRVLPRELHREALRLKYGGEEEYVSTRLKEEASEGVRLVRERLRELKQFRRGKK
jgi:parallel beta-helix repeat protein